jgi:isoquinoline 1-oxidoreductase alpha subunit
MLFTISVNSQLVRVDANPYMPLAWLLREKLGLLGAKFSCRAGLCVACMVNLDGLATRSCMVPVSTIGAAKVVTMEGCSGPLIDTIKRAWTEVNVPDCAYCKPGVFLAVAGLLERSLEPTDLEITRSLGSYCSCRTDPVVRYAVHRAARSLAEMRNAEKLRRGPMFNRRDTLRRSELDHPEALRLAEP